jgi:hypothetical protein
MGYASRPGCSLVGRPAEAQQICSCGRFSTAVRGKWTSDKVSSPIIPTRKVPIVLDRRAVTHYRSDALLQPGCAYSHIPWNGDCAPQFVDGFGTPHPLRGARGGVLRAAAWNRTCVPGFAQVIRFPRRKSSEPLTAVLNSSLPRTLHLRISVRSAPWRKVMGNVFPPLDLPD